MSSNSATTCKAATAPSYGSPIASTLTTAPAQDGRQETHQRHVLTPTQTRCGHNLVDTWVLDEIEPFQTLAGSNRQIRLPRPIIHSADPPTPPDLQSTNLHAAQRRSGTLRLPSRACRSPPPSSRFEVPRFVSLSPSGFATWPLPHLPFLMADPERTTTEPLISSTLVVC